MKKCLLSIGLVVLMTGCVGKPDTYYHWNRHGFIESYQLPDSVAAVEGYNIKATMRVVSAMGGLDIRRQEDRIWILKHKYRQQCQDIEIVNETFIAPPESSFIGRGSYTMDAKCL
ncbi:hypothetical protein ACQKPX_07190 [Photobacterium sp. DNB23_23_1]